MPLFDSYHARSNSGASYHETSPRFTFTAETSGRQVLNAEHHGTRKRRNGDHSISSIRGFTAQPWTSTSSASHFDSPAPLAHDRYTLAGGSIEGANSFTRQTGNYDDYFNLQSQRGMWSSPTSPTMQPVDAAAAPNAPSSWVVDSLLNIVGGVAGRLFQFCAVPFRGFQAGGGQSYDADAQIKIASQLGLHDEPEPSSPAAPVQQIRFDPRASFDYGVRSIDSLDDRPRPKRLRTEDAWVMVGPDDAEPAPPRLSERSTPARTPVLAPTYTPVLAPAFTPVLSPPYTPRTTPTPSQIPRPHSRTPSHRPSLIPVSRRSTTRTPLHHTSLPGPKSAHARSSSRLSFGSTPGAAPDDRRVSPLPADSQRLVTKLRREELEDDARMRRMSSQMSAMLREAREALGSRVEIEECEEMI
ncbi:hypothetical protein C7974DRAFT_323798 [Boeremia exigua]|uniref:uncharacterized protein n=1 Tax=Boeremia exigua TaxID=749465 RepID=UPI001E8DC31C|nr:uncharacterized protein C7974DRAFT_323798 [Boeremia exigua]KAH6612065.1 hypothetical protein C7974DRAFT_323798 [Boeremia exigua]